MATQEAIRSSLVVARDAGDAARLKQCYHAITHNLASQSTFRAGLESLVICAETALQVGPDIKLC